MIRRNIQLDGNQQGWMFISQPDHALLAALLAKDWRDFPLPDSCREEFETGIIHHDDGWYRWEERPTINPSTGVPREFTEMRFAESLRIWQDSIDVAQQIGPLAAYITSRHFDRLFATSAASSKSGGVQNALAVRFHKRQRFLQNRFLRQWRGRDPAKHRAPLAELATALLQLFDRISLWLACAARAEPWSVEVPQAAALQFSPSDDATLVRVHPWPFTRDRLTLRLSGPCLPVRRFQTDAEWQVAFSRAPSVELNLHLTSN